MKCGTRKKARREPKAGPKPIRCGYADPPYLGHGADYSVPGTKEYHPDAMKWDDPAEHVRLMEHLDVTYPDGWAMSTNAEGLDRFLHLKPPGARLAPWVTSSTGAFKMFRVVYAWEGVIYKTPLVHRATCAGRPAQLDWISAGKGHHSDVEGSFLGAKPQRFCFWLFRLLGLGGHVDDKLDDLFPGSGAVTRAWQEYQGLAVRARNGNVQSALFAETPPQRSSYLRGLGAKERA